MLSELNFSYGLLTPVLGFLMSCLGAFLALRCTSRAREYSGAVKAPVAGGGRGLAGYDRDLGHALHRDARLHHPGHDHYL